VIYLETEAWVSFMCYDRDNEMDTSFWTNLY